MEHLILQALRSDEMAEYSRTTAEVIANFYPINLSNKVVTRTMKKSDYLDILTCPEILFVNNSILSIFT